MRGNFVSRYLDKHHGGWRPGGNTGGTDGQGGGNPLARAMGMGTMAWGTGLAMGGYDKGLYNDLQGNLDPLRDSISNYGDMIQMYKDPNSQFNQGQRDQVRNQNMDYMYDMQARDRARSLGTGYEGLGKSQDDTMMTSAISSGLQNLSNQRGQQMQQASNLMGQQSQMQNALSQAGTQNMMYAQQHRMNQADLMSQQGLGMFKYGNM